MNTKNRAHDWDVVTASQLKKIKRGKKLRSNAIKAEINNPIIRRKLIAEGRLFVDGKQIDEACPSSKDGVHCPECGTELDYGYGFAGGYGLGGYASCDKHGYFDFCEDLGH